MSDQYPTEQLVAVPDISNLQPAVGQQLKAAREARGLEVLDIAQTLKLGVRQVEALENGDWQGLPGNTFIRGFIRNYARVVQIDPQPLMEQLDRILAKPVNMLVGQETRPAEMPRAGGSGSGRDRAVVMTGGALVVLAALAYFLLPNDLSALRNSTQGLLDSLSRKDTPAPVVMPAPAAVEPIFPPGATPQQVMNPQAVAPGDNGDAAAKAAPAQATSGAEAEAAVAVVKPPQMRFVFDKESWLEVRDRDNKAIFSQKVPAGTEQTLSGQGPLSLVIGYAPGVRVFWRGQAIDLTPHIRGEVARLVLE